MAGGPGNEEVSDPTEEGGTSTISVSRRLRLLTLLLVIVGVLGIASALMVATSPAGEGLDGLLPDDEADVMGQVRDADGYLVEGAVVTYVRGGLSDTTGTTGWYFLEGVETGKVVLRMEADGYKTVDKTVHLERGKYTVDFLAEPGSGTVEVPGIAVPEPGDAGDRTWLMAMGMGIASVFALLGAYAAHIRRWYPLVIVGGIFGILSWGWFVGSAISMVALVIAVPLQTQFGPKAIRDDRPWHEPPPPDLEVPDDEGSEGEAETPIDVGISPTSPPGPTGPGGMPPGR
jgi:hypothetical protein